MPVATPSYPVALVSEGTFDSIPHTTLTPAIGTEFPSSVHLRDLLSSPSAVRDLALLVSQRGVVFFREQDLTPQEQLVLVDGMGRLSGRPAESGLHIHPLANSTDELGAVFKITAVSSIPLPIALLSETCL
jgi:alpha-ketoglutarate-dependent taurine dioxygenase